MSRMELEIDPLLTAEHRQLLEIVYDECDDKSTEYMLQFCADSLESNFPELKVGQAHELVMGWLYEQSQEAEIDDLFGDGSQFQGR